MNPVLFFFLAITRVLCLGYVVMAGFGFIEARQLLSGTYELRGSTLYIPLEICQPSSISVDGNTISTDATDVGRCQTLDYLVNACAISLVFSAVAVLIYMVVDGLLRIGRGPFGKATVAGMGLFLLFILIQTTVCIYALWSQARFWTDYFNDVYDALDSANNYGIDNVTTHGNSLILLVVGILAVVVAGAVLIDSIVMLRSANAPMDDSERGGSSKFQKHDSFASSGNTSDVLADPSQPFEQPSAGQNGNHNNGTPAWASPI